MNKKTTLPVLNEHGYFEIRLESIGGLGANLCGKMLGELGALTLSLNSLSFSSYGSEKRGSPVKAYIRWCENEKPLRVNSPVTHPHILAIFHEGLIGTYPVLDGVSVDTKIILNTPLSPEEAAEKYHITMGELYCLDALAFAMESKSRINMVMLGAIARSPVRPPLTMQSRSAAIPSEKYPALIDANLTGVELGYTRLAKAETERNVEPLKKPAANNLYGAMTTRRSAASIRVSEARFPIIFLPPEKAIFLSLFRKNASTAGCATPPVRIWYSNLPPASTKERNVWSIRA